MASSPFDRWLAHHKKWKDCTLCPLGFQRSTIVLARGSVPCDVLLVGEAPGDSEDAIGQPFVGPAGRKLDRIVNNSIGGAVESGVVTVGYTNIVACYPRAAKNAGTNEPEPEEIEACNPRLMEFVRICNPRLVVAVGELAQTWLKDDMMKLGIPTVHIHHPAYIIRKPLAQQGMLDRRCEVTLINAVEEMLAQGAGT